MSEVLAEKPTVIVDSFDGSFIAPEERVQTTPLETKEETTTVEDKKPETVIEKKEEPLIEVKQTEIEQPKIEPKQEPLKYANEDSRKVHELLLAGKTDDVLDILNKQKSIDKLLNAAVDKNSAKEIIKLQLSKQFEGLKPDQLEYKFNKMYAMPKEPVQRASELDEEFEERQNEWKEAVQNAENDLLIDAEIAKPELAKLKIDLQLPSIGNTDNAKPPTQEELQQETEAAQQFIQTATDVINKFEGFNVAYKDKDVNIQSTYSLSNEEKASVLGKMQTLAENNYNANAIFAERWVNDDGTFNFANMTKDLASLETDDKRSQKYVSDATAKAKLEFIKGKHNIDLGKSTEGQMQVEDKTIQQKKEDAIWGV